MEQNPNEIKISELPEINNLIPIFKKQYVKCGDRHVIGHVGPYLIDASGASITCDACKQELNPYWVLEEMARAEHRYKRLIEEYKRQRALVEDRTKTKCDHCKKMTKIHIKTRFNDWFQGSLKQLVQRAELMLGRARFGSPNDFHDMKDLIQQLVNEVKVLKLDQPPPQDATVGKNGP